MIIPSASPRLTYTTAPPPGPGVCLFVCGNDALSSGVRGAGRGREATGGGSLNLPCIPPLSSDNYSARAGVCGLQQHQLPHEGPTGDEGLGEERRGQALHP